MGDKTNIRLIWDTQTENTPEQGWYTRHDEYGHYGYLDDPIGDDETTMPEALALACERFGVDESEIKVEGYEKEQKR